MKKNSCTPINPKKYSCYGVKKVHTRNLITKKNSCDLKIPHLPPLTFLMVRPLHAGVRCISYIAINKYVRQIRLEVCQYLIYFIELVLNIHYLYKISELQRYS